MRYRGLFLAFFLIVGIPAGAIALEVTNVKATQRTGTKLVDITYDLKTDDSTPVTISVMISDDGGATFNVKAQTFSGDVGPNISSGTGKRIVWDAGTDVPSVSGTRYRAKVIATAGQVAINGRIWFLSPKTPGGTDDEIWSMEPDGSDTRKEIAASFGNYGNLSMSPDGTQVAFVHYEGNNDKVEIQKTSGGLASGIYDSGQGYAILSVGWSSDGRKIGITRFDNLTLVDINSLSFFGLASPLRIPSVLSLMVGAKMSPDTSQVLLTGSPQSYGYSISGVNSSKWGSVYVIKPDGTSRRRILGSDDQGDFGRVSVSPDGSQITYSRKDKGIFIANSDGTRETQLSSQKGDRVSWSPDGKQIVFNDQDVRKLYKINVDGTGLQAIEPKGSVTFAPWSPAWSRR